MNNKDLYIETLYHYLAEIYYILNDTPSNNKDEKKIKEYMNKIKNKNKIVFNELNNYISLINENNFDKFKSAIESIITPS